jgi:TolB protein
MSFAARAARAAPIAALGFALGSAITALALLSPAAAAGQAAASTATAAEHGRIAFWSLRDGRNDVYTMRPTGGGVRNLTHDPAADFDPTWSPDGRRIAFTSNRGGDLDQLFTMDRRGVGLVRLTSLVRGNAAAPDWSPTGRRLAFYVDFGPRDPEVYVVGIDGSGLRRITRNRVSDSSPAWSPDGGRLAIERNARIATIDPDGSHARFLTPPRLHAFDPAWSPSGRRIAFIARAEGADASDLFCIGVNGTGLQRVTRTTRSESHPSWSPDGRRIAYVLTLIRSEAGVEEHAIFTSRPDGGGRRMLSSGRAAFDRAPDWGSVRRAAGYAIVAS